MRLPYSLWGALVRGTLWPLLWILASTTALVLLLLVVRLGELAPGASLGVSDILPLFTDGLPHLSTLTLPVAWLGALLLCLGQFSADGGFVAARAAGIGPMRLCAPLLLLGALLSGASLYVALEVEPAANRNLRSAFVRIAKTGAVTGLRPGTFSEALGDVTLHVGARGLDGALREVMLSDRRDERTPVVVFAEAGRLAADETSERLLLTLENGELHAGARDGRHFRRATFARYELAFDLRELLARSTTLVSPFDELDFRGMGEEIERTRARGHVTWRYELAYHRKLAAPFAPLLFALFGVGLALGRVRAPRVRAVLVAVLLLATYFGLQRAADTLASELIAPPWLCAWLPAAALLPAALFLCVRLARGRR